MTWRDLSCKLPSFWGYGQASVIKANMVLICGENPFSQSLTFITAHTLVISGVNVQMVGSLDKILSITTSELIIEGENKVSAKGKDGASTLLSGPSISISAEKVSGNGKIEISSEGANYQKEQK